MSHHLRKLVLLLLILSGAAAARAAPVAEPVRSISENRFASVNGVRLHYRITGRGSPVLLVHGFPETSYAWRKITPGLAVRHTVIAVDLRGAGLSGKSGPYDTATMAEDLHQLVRSLGYPRIDVVGHDVGVAVVYPYAAQHSDEVGHLVLLDVPPQGTQAFEKLRAKAWTIGFQAIPDMPEALVAGREELYLRGGFYDALSWNKAAFSPADVAEYVRAYSAPGAMHAALGWYRAFAVDIRQNRKLLRRKLPMPVLLLGGDHSGASLMPETGREIANRFEVGVIANSGHWLAEEQPDAVSARVLRFIDGPQD